MPQRAPLCRLSPYLLLVMPLLVNAAGGQESEPKPRLTDDELVTFCLREEGNADEGRALFLSDRLSCSQCHSVDGTRGKLGPDLTAAGDKFGRREIIHAIMFPSAAIAVGYEQSVIQTTSGRVFVGLIKQATNEWCEIVGVDGMPVRVLQEDIEERQPLAISAMPQGVHAALSPTELNDLVEYLVSLKQPESALQLAHGMPREIRELPQSVDLIPLVPESLKFSQPVWMVPVPDTPSAFLVNEHQTKMIWYLEAHQSLADCRKSVFVDLGPGPGPGPLSEGRLSCLAFHPNFRDNRKYYLYDRIAEGATIEVVISERVASDDGQRDAGVASREILRVTQSTLVHFGGWLGFGPDGFLYASFGDSGPQEDPQGNAQNRSLLLGKIIRIDVDRSENGKAYAVPPDNPFVDHGEIPGEVWALGFRAPWRCSFDRVTGDLWVGDVGQDRYEEVDIVRRGENHGWNVFEGFGLFSNQFRREAEGYVSPVFAYARKYGRSITGGHVFRAQADSSFAGTYICGDFESRRLFAITHDDRVLRDCRQIGTSPQRIVSFAEDHGGDIYVVGYEGMIYRIDCSRSRFE